ncbi:hypothetical protein ACFLWR_04925 [Chloroflexota bacterium]
MSQNSSSFPRTIIKFVLLTIGLGIIGLAFGLAGALIGGRLLGGDSVGFGALGLALLGIIVGYPTGIIAGIIIIKKVLHQNGSLWLGILGSILGAIITLIIAEPINLNSNPNLLFGVFFLNVPIFCLVGFSLKNLRKRHPKGNSLTKPKVLKNT